MEKLKILLEKEDSRRASIKDKARHPNGTKMRIKALFLCKKRIDHYGISVGLINSATFVVNALNKRSIESRLDIVIDANEIDRVVSSFRPTHAIVEAIWVTPDKMRELLKRHPKVTWVIRVHSKAAFIAHEGMAMEWLSEYAQLAFDFKNLRISANSSDFNQELSDTLEVPCVYLPNVYHPEVKQLPEKVADPEIVDVGCFGAIRPLKNQLVQGMAAIRFGNSIKKIVRFHINSNRVESGDGIVRNLRAIFRTTKHKLIEHPWTPHDEFLATVRKMDIGMQVSLSESFNIVTADMVIEGVPVVVSPEIGWIPRAYQANPHDIVDIVSKMVFVHQRDRFAVAKHNRKALDHNNSVNISIWLSFLR